VNTKILIYLNLKFCSNCPDCFNYTDCPNCPDGPGGPGGPEVPNSLGDIQAPNRLLTGNQV
jgi:hypothetical protein